MLRRRLPSIWCLLAAFSAVTVLAVMVRPVLGQDTGASPTDMGAFEKIDGTTLKPAILSYDATVKTGGRSQDLSSTQTFARTSAGGTDTWTLVNKIQTPRGVRTDSLVVDRSSLLPISRHLRGGTELDLTYSRRAPDRSTPNGMNVSGTMKSGGRSKPISKSLDGPTLAQGVHDIVALGAMPLQPGFKATLRVFSPRDQSTKRAEFEVTGTETVKTPAGSFETYAVDLNVGEGQVTGTVHLRKKAPHYYVKWETEVSTSRGTRTISQTLSSMEIGASSGVR